MGYGISTLAPSLLMPQEGLLEDFAMCMESSFTISRDTTLGILLICTVCVPVSFAAALNAVMPVQYSWQHQGLTFYPTLVRITLFSCIILFNWWVVFRCPDLRLSLKQWNCSIRCLYSRIYYWPHEHNSLTKKYYAIGHPILIICCDSVSPGSYLFFKLNLFTDKYS